MMVGVSQIGSPLILRKKGEEPVHGWIYRQLPDGYLLAMDKEGKDIRFFRFDQYEYVTATRGNRADFAVPNADLIEEKVAHVQHIFGLKTFDGLQKIDLGKIRSVNNKSNAIKSRINGVLLPGRRISKSSLIRVSHQMDSHYDGNPPIDAIISYYQVDRSASIAKESLQTLEGSGLDEMAREAAEALREVPAKYLIPEVDGPLVGEEFALNVPDFPREIESELAKIEELLQANRDTPLEIPQREPTPGRSGKWAGASLRLATGAGLMASNVTLGLMGGLTSTVATLGATAVPVYVGVLMSIAAGLVQISEGTERISALLDSE